MFSITRLEPYGIGFCKHTSIKGPVSVENMELKIINTGTLFVLAINLHTSCTSKLRI